MTAPGPLSASAASAAPASELAADVLFYDGTCGLCSRTVRFVLAHEREPRFRFAPLQGAFAAEALRRFGVDAADLSTMYVLTGHATASERLLARGRAALYVASRLTWPWRLAGAFLVLPTPLLDWLYGAIARHRYRIGGRADGCVVPSPEHRHRFIDG